MLVQFHTREGSSVHLIFHMLWEAEGVSIYCCVIIMVDSVPWWEIFSKFQYLVS